MLDHLHVVEETVVPYVGQGHALFGRDRDTVLRPEVDDIVTLLGQEQRQDHDASALEAVRDNLHSV